MYKATCSHGSEEVTCDCSSLSTQRLSFHTRRFSDCGGVQDESGPETWPWLEVPLSPLEGEWVSQVFWNLLFTASCRMELWASDNAVGFSKCLDSGSLPSSGTGTWKRRGCKALGWWMSTGTNSLSGKIQSDPEVPSVPYHMLWPPNITGQEGWRPGLSPTLYTCRQVPQHQSPWLQQKCNSKAPTRCKGFILMILFYCSLFHYLFLTIITIHSQERRYE